MCTQSSMQSFFQFRQSSLRPQFICPYLLIFSRIQVVSCLRTSPLSSISNISRVLVFVQRSFLLFLTFSYRVLYPIDRLSKTSKRWYHVCYTACCSPLYPQLSCFCKFFLQCLDSRFPLDMSQGGSQRRLHEMVHQKLKTFSNSTCPIDEKR